MSIIILKVIAMSLLVTGGSVVLKFFADTESLYMFTLSLSLYMAGTVVMADLIRGGMPLGATVLIASILQLVFVQAISVVFFDEPFRPGAMLMALVAVFYLLQPSVRP